MDKFKKIVKTSIVLVSAYIISTVILSFVYVGNSPFQVRPNLGPYLIAKLKTLSNPKEFIASLFPKKDPAQLYAEKKINEGFANLQKVAFTQVAPGVSVRAAENVSETSYTIGSVKWIKHKVTIRGVEHEYGWPEGKPLPSQAVLESLY